MSDSRSEGTGRPLSKPVGAGSFVRPAAFQRPALTTESFVPFTPEMALDGFEADLPTTGFAGVEALTPIVEATVQEPAVPVEIAIPAPKPILEVRPSTTPITVYEPIQFLDYDDEDDSFGAMQEEPAPEPPVLTEFALVPAPKPAAPSPAKLQQGFAPVPPMEAPVELPELALRTARPNFVYGPNPSAPPQPAPAPVMKQAPVITKPARPEPQKNDRDKRSAKPAPPPASRPVRDRGNAVPVEEAIPEPPAPLTKPKMVPIRRPELLAPAAAVSDVPMLGLPQTETSSKSKLAMVAALVVTLGAGGYFLFSGDKTSAASSTESASGTVPGMVLGGGGWTTTWGADTPSNRGKQISIYRPSMTMPDYRFEFRGQIERKAMGWIFRASNPKNYYVMKLDTIKPGPNPLVALVKYAVVDGKESTRTQVMLPFDVKAGTVYQVRLDVSGDKFTTYVQDKLVDYWNDSRIKLGGTGFYNDPGERAQIKSSQVSYLR